MILNKTIIAINFTIVLLLHILTIPLVFVALLYYFVKKKFTQSEQSLEISHELYEDVMKGILKWIEDIMFYTV